MAKVKMTIHRGLSELKTLDDRIERAKLSIVPNGIKQKDKKVDNILDENEFAKSARENLQSFADLLDRKKNIKKAIVESNATTHVSVAGKEMTVADAITEKLLVEQKKGLIQHLKRQHTASLAKLNTNNEQISANAKQMAINATGGDLSKVNDNQATQISKTYTEMNEWSIVDPLDTLNLIKKMEAEVSEFETEVDATLSESNATTTIEV